MLGGLKKVKDATDSDKPTAMAAFCSGIATSYFKLIERILCKTNGKFLAGDKVTIADFVLASLIHNFICNDLSPAKDVLQSILPGCPKLQAYIKCNQTEFKEWNAKRTP